MTRYPLDKEGKTAKRKWTVKELDSITAAWKGDTLSDTEGLVGDVRATSSGSISIAFKYGFKWQGKKVWHYCGSYPSSALTAIRTDRDNARSLVKSGVDPRASKKSEKIDAQAAVEATIKADDLKRTEALTFNDLYNTWIKDGVKRSDGNKYLTQSLGKHAIPALGNVKLQDLTEHHLRDTYRNIISTGKIATAVELSKDIGQMLRWAEKRKPWRGLMIDGNPSNLVNVKLLTPTGYTKQRKRLLSNEEILKLQTIFETMTQNYANAPKKVGTSPLSLIAYNKREQLIKDTKIDIGYERTRIEARLNLPETTLYDLASNGLKDPWESTYVVLPELLEQHCIKSKMPKGFYNSLRKIGLYQTMKLFKINHLAKKAFIGDLPKLNHPLWLQGEFWAAHMDMIKRCLPDYQPE